MHDGADTACSSELLNQLIVSLQLLNQLVCFLVAAQPARFLSLSLLNQRCLERNYLGLTSTHTYVVVLFNKKHLMLFPYKFKLI